MKSFASAVAVLPFLVSSTRAVRTFVVKNNCAYGIWPAIFTDLNVGSSVPDYATGWYAAPNTQVSFSVPDNWTAGRIWGRRVCDFSVAAPPLMCASGGCNGGLECDIHSGSGVPPATLAEFTLSGFQNLDWYDVSVVDGFNLPIRIDNDADCPVPNCTVDLNANCPLPLALSVAKDDNLPGGCQSACQANLDGQRDGGSSGNCCSGTHGTPATCPKSGVQYYSYFKDNCPDAYAYAYDEGSESALWTCSSSKKANYTVTFCPAH